MMCPPGKAEAQPRQGRHRCRNRWKQFPSSVRSGIVRRHNPIAVASNLRLGAKRGKMPPLTGRARRWPAVAIKIPRRWRSGSRRETGDRVEPIPPKRRAVPTKKPRLRRSCCPGRLERPKERAAGLWGRCGWPAEQRVASFPPPRPRGALASFSPFLRDNARPIKLQHLWYICSLQP